MRQRRNQTSEGVENFPPSRHLLLLIFLLLPIIFLIFMLLPWSLKSAGGTEWHEDECS